MIDYDIKMIALDLDDTTLTTEKVLTPRTKNVIEECLRRGIVVLPATGRAKKAIPDYLKTIEGLRFVLTSNGAAVIDLQTGETIYENPIPWERALEIYDILDDFDTYYDAYADGCGWVEGKRLEMIDTYEMSPHIQKLVHDSRVQVDDLREKLRTDSLDVEKINVFLASEEKRQTAFAVLKDIPDLSVACSVKYNIEINNSTCNKGDALMALGRILGIEPCQIMACGDGLNDLEMIRQAGLGVAMENAYEEVKQVADFITLKNDEEGVAYAIEKFVLK